MNERLLPFKKQMEEGASWKALVQLAWLNAVNLIVSTEYERGDIPPYDIYGLSLSEIEIDVLTGKHILRRVDILEDAGQSLNPAVDVGQIEGAFIMGLGYWLTEQLVYDRQTGKLLTNRTWNYKPPGAKDIPVDFRIELLQNNPNPVGFMRSKATGEPACCLAISIIFALQQAIQSARDDAGLNRQWVRLNAPTTADDIVSNCGTQIDQFRLS